jgi:biotin carboxylase
MRSVIIVSAGLMQIPAILTAKKMGLNVIATDRDPKAPGFRYADVRVVMDTKDVEGHVRYAIANQEKYNIIGAFAGSDVAITVAAITNALGLPGIPLKVAIRSNNKALMKKKWLQDGIPTAMSFEVTDYDGAVKAIKKIGRFPVMVKAVDSAASRGSRKIDSMDQLKVALIDAKKFSTTGTALIEEHLEGSEQSVETIVYKNIHHRFGIADRIYDFDPYKIEIGHSNPSRLPKKTQEAIYKVVEKAARSLGITFGPAKADMILTKDGPKIIEMPARLSGGFHSQFTTPLSTGMDPIKAALTIATGGHMPASASTHKWNRVSICKCIFPKPGRVVSIIGVEKAKKIKGVEHVIMYTKKGDVISSYKSCADIVCYIIVVGKDYEEANNIFDRAASTVKINTSEV